MTPQMKTIPRAERLIAALDVAGVEEAKALVRRLGDSVTFAAVHGNRALLEAAARAKGDVKILAVTVLTSLDQGDLDDLGFQCDVETLVLSRARRALGGGCGGGVSSGLEAAALGPRRGRG